MSGASANGGGRATWVGTARALPLVPAAALVLALACAGPGRPLGPGPSLYAAPAPSQAERYCAWYGDARDGVLYFGASAFWWASRGPDGARGSVPRGDLRRAGPVRIGRFDLARERWLPPLALGPAGARAGVWDVLAHENGRIYFTTFFEATGFVEPATGRVQRLPGLGPGLNELARGPGASLLVSRYGSPSGDGSGDGSVVHVDLEGRLLAEHPVRAPAGYRSAPKTVAWDPGRREIWVTSDLLPLDGGALRHDAYVLDAEGRERRRIARPELQFAAFSADGTGFFAESGDGALWLRIVAPGATPAWRGGGRRVLLDGDFPAHADFAQDVKPGPQGGALVTRWSGAVHAVDAAGRVRTLRLPRVDPDGLYYTAVRAGARRVCATHCADVQVVCAPAPAPDSESDAQGAEAG